MLTTSVIVDGLWMPECPRWHNGKLWSSDMVSERVMTLDLKGNLEVIVEVPGLPGGLGWLPDGRLLVVSMTRRRLLRLDPEGLVEVSDLNKYAAYHCNDMAVDARGNAYVGNYGFDYLKEPFAPAAMILVSPEGETRIVAEDLSFPNGTVITPDGKTLIVAETFAQRLTAFNIEVDGNLTGRRVWAQISECTPDGICLDQENAIWVANPMTGEVLRCCEGGMVTHRVRPKNPPFACMLGGLDGRTLFVCTAESDIPEKLRAKASGMIEAVQVDVPRAGLP
jgi:sugar lactone lactonase YvrE